jgi:hypothetical protein
LVEYRRATVGQVVAFLDQSLGIAPRIEGAAIQRTAFAAVGTDRAVAIAVGNPTRVLAALAIEFLVWNRWCWRYWFRHGGQGQLNGRDVLKILNRTRRLTTYRQQKNQTQKTLQQTIHCITPIHW